MILTILLFGNLRNPIKRSLRKTLDFEYFPLKNVKLLMSNENSNNK